MLTAAELISADVAQQEAGNTATLLLHALFLHLAVVVDLEKTDRDRGRDSPVLQRFLTLWSLESY